MTGEEIAARVSRGDPIAEIAAEAGLTPARISQIAREHGAEPRRRTGTADLDAQIAALLKRHYTQTEIAAELEIGRRQVQRAAERLAAGRPRQRSGRTTD